MKCKRCRRAEAAVDLPSHHAAFCPDCFFLFFRRQVTEGIRKLRLLAPGDRVLVCVSGGKDSLVLWDVLMDEGYETEGLYIDLGIDGYSDRSKEKVLAYAASRGKTPIVVELAKEGIPIPEAARCVRMQECSVCGTVKRYFFNRVAAEGKFTVVATGLGQPAVGVLPEMPDVRRHPRRRDERPRARPGRLGAQQEELAQGQAGQHGGEVVVVLAFEEGVLGDGAWGDDAGDVALEGLVLVETVPAKVVTAPSVSTERSKTWPFSLNCAS